MLARNEYEAHGILTSTELSGGASACYSGTRNRDSEGSNVESRLGTSVFSSDTMSFKDRQSDTRNLHESDVALVDDGAAHLLQAS